MKLSKGFKALAETLQEAAADLSHADLRAHLQSALQAKHPDNYPYITDTYGDSEQGDVVYHMGGKHKKAPYEISSRSGSAPVATIGNPIDVMPRTVYDQVPDEAQWIASMEAMSEADKKLARYPHVARMLFTERYIPKSERDKMPSEDFAGKGTSFPIKTQDDVDAAFHSLGRAGADNYSTATIRANIIRIAKRKGFTLPKSAQGDSTESARENETDNAREARLVESTVGFAGFDFKEADAMNPMVKIINAGRGSSGYYSKEVLMRDGPQVFKPGTLMFVNHATPAEEAARPEGDWNKLAGVTVGPAYWDEAGKDGPALYAPAKIFSDYAQQVKEKAPHTGVSIRASGVREDRTLGPDGKPGVITALKQAHSIDLVTAAGRGGKLLTEAVQALKQFTESRKEDNEMTEAEVTKLLETKIPEALKPLQAENRKLRERVALADAGAESDKILGGLSLHPGVRARVKARVLSAFGPALMTESGDLDPAKFKTFVEAEAKEEAEYVAKLSEGGRVLNMGPAAPGGEAPKPEEIHKQLVESFKAQGMTEAQAIVAATGRAA